MKGLQKGDAPARPTTVEGNVFAEGLGESWFRFSYVHSAPLRVRYNMGVNERR